LAVLLFVVVKPAAAFILVVRVGRENVEAEAEAITAGCGTAPKTLQFTVRRCGFSPFNEIAVIFPSAMEAMDLDGDFGG